MAKTSIGKAWAKIFHTEAIPGVKADNPYFVVVVKETQRWGNQIILLADNPYFVVVVKETQRWGNQIILLKDRRR
jgi:nitrogen fixation protein